MRSTTSSPRRLRSRPPRHRRLEAIARVVDDGTIEAPGHVLVHVAAEPVDDVELGIREVPDDSHPFDVLAGFEAPDHWWAFGVRVRGRARFLDDVERAPEPVATTFLVDRDGDETSLLRAGGEVSTLPGPAVGTIPDLCRRVLGLPTAPPPPTTATLWCAIWLDRLLEAWGEPTTRHGLSSSWGAVAGLHPAMADGGSDEPVDLDDPRALVEQAGAHTAARPWERLRLDPAPLALPDGPLPADIAAWMDDGFYARWCLGAYPSIATMAADLRALLGDPHGSQLLRTMIDLLEVP